MSRSPHQFYPETCHTALTRRQLLLGGGALLAGATALAGRAFADKTFDGGTAIVRTYAASPDDPWGVAHGVRAMGRDFTIKGGRGAVDHLLEHVLASVSANGQSVLAFDIETEIHPNAFLSEAILEPGVPLDHGFMHHGRRRTVSDVVAGARALLRPSQVASVPNALPWTVLALTRTTSPLHRQWTNAWGEPVDLDALVESALGLLVQASLPIAQAMREGRALTAQAPVHAFTCGGTHMLYGLLTAVHRGYVGTDRASRVQKQTDLLVWRLGADVDLIERFYQASSRGGSAPMSWFELDSKLKLLGHAEECLAFATRHGVVKLTTAQQAQRQAAKATLRRLIEDLEQRNLAEARALNSDLYKQLVGDTCHARHGLRLA